MSHSNHQSVLLENFLSFYEGRELKTFVDCTLGAGGHAKAILQAHPEIQLLIGIDQDPLALKIAEENLKSFNKRIALHRGNFHNASQFIAQRGITNVDGIFFDIGVSSMQLDLPEKGFSFSFDGPLDMRMDPSNHLSAEKVINSFSESDLGKIFKAYGEERHWRALAKIICIKRKQKRICSTKELAQLISSALGRQNKQKIHPATRVFQALRIYVNKELEVLQSALPQAIDLLSPKGRLGIICFHSLEDRIVKNIFREASSTKNHLPGAPDSLVKKDPSIRILTKKPLQATTKELAFNVRSRSAKMRFIEKI